MGHFTYATAALALLSSASAFVVPAEKPVQFNNPAYPTPSCLAVFQAVKGNQGVMGDCDPTAPGRLSNPLARSWVVSQGGASSGIGPITTIAVYGNLCLDVRDGLNVPGNPVQVYTCYSGNKNQQWNVNADGTITWAKDHTKCLDLDLRHGVTVINTCKSGTTSQKWNPNNVVPWPSAPINKSIQFQINDHHDMLQDNTGPCMAVKGTIVNGAAVNIQPCTVDITQKAWVVVNGGGTTGSGPSTPIKIGSESCLDVTDGKDENGTKLQVWKCYAGSKNQQFSVNADGSIKWLGGNNKCVDLTGGREADQVQLQIWTCGSSNYNQKWIPFPIPVVSN